jgi:acyl-CoA synthetase (AMP-forming)/AMP-acid ligase II
MDAYCGRGLHVTDHRTGASLDGEALRGAAAARALELSALGVARGARVVIAHGQGLGTLIDCLAVWNCGATAVMAAHGITSDERAIVARATQAVAWIGPPAPDGIPALPPAAPEQRAQPLPPLAALDDPALIMMTSGTTSRPKGVVLTHRAVQARLALNGLKIGTDLAVALNVLPMHFGHGLIGNVLTPLAAGATLILWPEPGAAGLPSLGAVIDSHGVTFMSSVPSLWRAALKLSKPPQGHTLRRVHVGSAPLATPLWADIAAWAGTRRVVNMYGITETANWIGGWSAEDGLDADGLVGQPWGGQLAVRMDDGRLQGTGRGEVAVNSPSLMAGYLDRPDLSEKSLVGDWFLTGDIGEIGPDGALRLIGRTRHEINRGGIKIPAEEIDALLERHPAIIEACAFPLPDPLTGEMVAAAIVLDSAQAATTEEVRAWCATRIRRDAVPSRLFVLSVLPRTDRGKLNRDQVREACLAASPAMP